MRCQAPQHFVPRSKCHFIGELHSKWTVKLNLTMELRFDFGECVCEYVSHIWIRLKWRILLQLKVTKVIKLEKENSLPTENDWTPSSSKLGEKKLSNSNYGLNFTALFLFIFHASTQEKKRPSLAWIQNVNSDPKKSIEMNWRNENYVHNSKWNIYE